MLRDFNEIATDFRTTSTFQIVFIEIIYELRLENLKAYLIIYLSIYL